MKSVRVYATSALAAKRMKKGYTQAQLVNMLKMYDKKIALSAYAKWETGERSLDPERAMLIAAFLGSPIWEIFKHIDKKEATAVK